MLSRPNRIEPGPGQESVWDYPRPPRLERAGDRLRVTFAGETIAETSQAYRVLETSHPPVYYFPPTDVRQEILVPEPGRSLCEFKGIASYWTLDVGSARALKAAWSYPAPTERFWKIKDYFAFYPSRVDGCWVGGERVQAQAGDFYGGWITSRVAGPFKGQTDTAGW